ncbi:MAG: outer membrane lipoprotein carrier protein LolA [Bryobacterales bacterium]|nr:outer membrane lipoprotein carrier protein LolA [Bryobacteraceae bacterium]MDW8355170.1 outer membrane lipoprotein carrier protein LolA [Bryobacterales bacterium]
MALMTGKVCLVLAAGVAAAQDLGRVLDRVEQRYNRARTIHVLFEQTWRVQGRPPRTESGELFLLKPGRMRWQYRVPPGKLFLSDGRFVYLYTPETNRAEKMPLKETEDLRAPLGFLLGRLDFRRDFGRFLSRPEGAALRVIAEPKSDRYPYTQVEFLVTPQHEIQYLRIQGQDHSIMEFRFAQEKIDPPLAASLFRFTLPPGAELVETVLGEER